MDDQDSNNQVITIEPEISKILGLQDNFDLDPDEYLQLIREKLAKYDFLSASKKITPKQQEEQRVLAPKVREIREQKRKGNVKYRSGKKVSSSSFFGKKSEQNQQVQKKITDPSKLLPGTAAPKKSSSIVKSKSQEVKELKQSEENKDINTISKILNSILDTLKNQFKFDQKKTDVDRKEKEKKKRERRELDLEKGFSAVKSVVNKILAPFQSIFDMVWRYIFFTFLGKAFTDLMNWLKDPNNEKKVKVLGRFLKDWWPLLLGAYLAFASPLRGFIKGTLIIVGKLTSKIVKLIPRLLKVSKDLVTSKPARSAASALVNIIKNPFVWFPAAVAGTAVLANEVTGQRKAASVQAENQARAQRGKGLGTQGTDTMSDRKPSPGNMGVTTPYGMVQGAKLGGIVRGLRGYSNGAEVLEDGYNGIDSNTGISITGAGRDTQLIAARPGEVVLTPEDVGHIQQKTGFDVYKFVGNRKPSYTSASKIKTTEKIPLANMGGILGFNKGGIVGGNKPPQISASDFYSLLAISALEDDKAQGRADVAQSLYNRLYAANRYKTNFNQSSNTIKGLITAADQYEPTFANKQDWMSITDRRSAAVAIMNSVKGRKYKWTLKDAMNQLSATEAALRNPVLQASAQKHVGGRPYFQGVSQQESMKPGDVLRSKEHNFFSPWYIEGTQYDRERRNIASPIPQMLLPQPPKDRGRQNRNKQTNPLQNIFNIFNPQSSYAKPRGTTKKSKRWALDPRGWFGMQGGGEIPQGPFTPLPSPGYVRPQGSFIPKPMLRLPGPMPGTTVPFGWNPFRGLQGGGMIGPSWMPWNWGKLVDSHRNAKPQDYKNQQGLGANLARRRQMYKQLGMQGGGSLTPVTTRTGIDIPGGVSGADTQYLPNYNVALQPGEEIFKYVIPKDSVQKGVGQKILDYANNVVANTDPNSNAAKIGMRNRGINIRPYSGRLNSNMNGVTMLPPIKRTAGTEASMMKSSSGSQTYSFDPVLSSSYSVRKMNCDIYGIVE